MKNSPKINSRTRILVKCSAACAAGYVLSYVKIFTMPQGGSITFAPLAIIIAALMCGIKAGAAAGGMLGLLKLITGGHIIGFIQAILDYPAAYAFLSLAALAPGKTPLTAAIFTIIAFAFKTAAHIYSGYLFFGGSLKTSIIYNLSYSLPETALCTLAIYALVKNGSLKL